MNEQLDLFATPESEFLAKLKGAVMLFVIVFGMGACVVGTISNGIKCRQAIGYEDRDGINKYCID